PSAPRGCWPVPEMEGRRGVSRRVRRVQRGRHTRTSAILTTILVVGLVVVGSGVLIGIYAAARYYNGLTQLDQLQARQQPQNSQIYASDGTLLTVIASSETRRRVPRARISPWRPKATIAIEARRFYEHHGVDWKAVGRAAVKNLKAGKVEEGGSTLTQQLVRNIF